MMKSFFIGILSTIFSLHAAAQTLNWDGREFEAVNVKAALVDFRGERVLKVERDLKAFPFVIEREVETVDDRHFMKLKNFMFKDGIFEVKVLARVQEPTPMPRSQGFIGVYFRVAEDNSAFESVYLEPAQKV